MLTNTLKSGILYIERNEPQKGEKMMNVQDLLNKVNEEGYEVVAIRHLAGDEEYEVGDMCRDSYDWDVENDQSSYYSEEPVMLDGTCGFHIEGFRDLDTDEIEEATEIFERARKEARYQGKMVVIAGHRFTYGNDEHEVIIRDAEVIAIED